MTKNASIPPFAADAAAQQCPASAAVKNIQPAASLLLHICCGPCAVMPVTRLLDEGFAVTGWFMNPNIHPLSEYLRRREAAGLCAERLGIPLLYADDTWDITAWLRSAAGRDTPSERCSFCCGSRMSATFAAAQRLGFAHFSSSLLYSRYQPHDVIAAAGRNLEQAATAAVAAVAAVAEDTAQAGAARQAQDLQQAKQAGEAKQMGETKQALNTEKNVARFIYRDFRTDWQTGIEHSKDWGLYRQAYCGCIYSEAERYAKKLKKLLLEA